MFKTLQYFGAIITMLVAIPGLAENTKNKLKQDSTVAIHAVAHGETFVRTKVDVGGLFPVIEPQTEYTKGVTNIDKGRVQHAQQVNYVQFGYDVALTADAKKPQDLLYRTDLPASFNSATLLVKQGKELLRIPVASLAQFGAWNPSERFVALDVPFNINNTEDLEVFIEYAKGAAAVALSDEFVYINFKGPRTNV